MKYSPDEHDGRPAAPESLVKRLCAWVDADGADPLHLEAATEIERLERRLSLAQTEIKEHMRVAKEVRVDALEEAAKVCDAYKEELLNEARAAPDGFAIVGYRQITAEYLAAAIRSLKSRA